MRALGCILAFLCACGGSDPTPQSTGACEAPAEDDGFGNAAQAGAPSCEPAAPPADCDAEPTAPGCPCLTGERRECYSGPEESLGVGLCRAGRQRCSVGAWQRCMGEVAPAGERCNDLDDDCDGVVDEGALSPCGGCNPACVGAVWGSKAIPFEPGDGLDLTGRGEVTLARHTRQSHSVWIPNSGEATVSKIDPGAAVELARYRSAPEPGRLSAERVAVDYNGDAWVLSSATVGRSRLLKIAGERERCVDRDDNGVSSSQGPADVLPFGQDECVLLDVALGEEAGMARSLAIGGALRLDDAGGGNVWVGMQNEARLLEVDGHNGEVLRSIDTPGLSPYASAFDPFGSLWVIDRSGLLARIEPWHEPARAEVIEANLQCYALESLTSDERGVLTLTGFSCENVVRFDPHSGRFQQLQAPGVLSTRGVVSLAEDSWVVHTSGRLSQVGRDPFEFLATFSLQADSFAPIESTGIGADSDDNLWVVSSMGGPGQRGVVTRFSSTERQVTAQVPVGFLPRGQGDITGGRVSGFFEPEASARRVFAGCESMATDSTDEPPAAPTRWRSVHVRWLGGPGAEVLVEARHAESRAALGDGSFARLGQLPDDEPPFALDFPAGGVVELRVTLRSHSPMGAPRVSNVGVEWRCPGPD